MKNLKLPKEKIFTAPALIWKRIAAFLIDIMVINFTILFPFKTLLESFVPQNYSFTEAYNTMGSNLNTGYIAVVSVLMFLLVMLYFAKLEKKYGQTIGKRLLKLHVASDNKEIKSWQIYVRSIFFIPIFPFLLLWLLDPLFMIFTKTGQRLSEILSKTRTVENYNLEQNW